MHHFINQNATCFDCDLNIESINRVCIWHSIAYLNLISMCGKSISAILTKKILHLVEFLLENGQERLHPNK